jgi:hypothetical protein
MTRAPNSQWIVGPEYDQDLFLALAETLGALGYKIGAESVGLGGSPLISSWSVDGPNGTLQVEAQTYIGLSVSGPSALVNEAQQAFQTQRAPHG